MASTEIISSRRSSSNGCLMLFGLPFLIVGLLLSVGYFNTLGFWWSAQSWVEVPCWIDQAKLETIHDTSSRDGKVSTTYKVTASYHYEYDGHPYRSDRVALNGGSDNISSFQQNAAAELKEYVGGRQAFRCYVNSQHPEQALLYRELRLGVIMLFIVFPLIFPAAGAAIIGAAWWNWRNSKAEAIIRTEHPDQPWRWKTGWAGESLKSSPARKPLLLYVVWSGLHILPLLAAVYVSGRLFTESGLLILPLVILWSIPVGVALRHFRQDRITGEISFRPETWPISQANGLSGQLMFSRPVSLRSSMEFTVSCARETMRSTGKGKQKQSESLWSTTETIDGNRAISDLSGTRVPLSIALPSDAPDATMDEAEVNHVWTLKMHCKEPRISASFDLPVFETAPDKSMISSIGEVAPSISLNQIEEDQLEHNLRAAGLQVSFTADGMLQSIASEPGRHRNSIYGLSMFALFWSGLFIYLLKSDAPRLFPVIWGVTSAALWWVILNLVLGKHSATFTRDGVEIESEMKGLWRRRKFHARNTLLNFTCTTNMRSGNTSYYTVNLAAMSGLKGKVADAIPSAATAEALVRRLEKWRTDA